MFGGGCILYYRWSALGVGFFWTFCLGWLSHIQSLVRLRVGFGRCFGGFVLSSRFFELGVGFWTLRLGQFCPILPRVRIIRFFFGRCVLGGFLSYPIVGSP